MTEMGEERRRMQPQSGPGLFFGGFALFVGLFFIGSISKYPVPWVITLQTVNLLIPTANSLTPSWASQRTRGFQQRPKKIKWCLLCSISMGENLIYFVLFGVFWFFFFFEFTSGSSFSFAGGLSCTPQPNTLPSAVIGHVPGQEEAVGIAGCDCSSW